MIDRLAAGVEASALIRRIEVRGGVGTVLAKGDAGAGAILLICCDRGEFRLLLERAMTAEGGYCWRRSGPQAADGKEHFEQYLARRRHVDPDIWLIELDIAGVERFAAELIASG